MTIAGKIIFSSGVSVNFDIWSLDLTSGKLTQLTFGDNLNDYPRWSPDGKYISYVSTEADMIPSLLIMNADGSSKRKITSNMYCQSPSWSPDGSHLIFTANSIDKNEIDVYSIKPDGSSLKRIFNYRGIEEKPSYSPSGDSIIFSSVPSLTRQTEAEINSEIIEYNINQNAFKVIASHPAKDYAPTYSPDGKVIAFVSHRKSRSVADYRAALEDFKNTIINGDNSEAREALKRLRNFEEDGDIFLINSDGTGLKQLTKNSYADNNICWSPCGKYLLYTSAPSDNNASERLVIVEASSGKEVSFSYDRTPLENEIGSLALLNSSLFQRLTPDFIERWSIDKSFWGEERNPHWIE